MPPCDNKMGVMAPMALASLHKHCTIALRHKHCTIARHKHCTIALHHKHCTIALRHKHCTIALRHKHCTIALCHKHCTISICNQHHSTTSQAQNDGTTSLVLHHSTTSHRGTLLHKCSTIALHNQQLLATFRTPLTVCNDEVEQLLDDTRSTKSKHYLYIYMPCLIPIR